MNTAILLYDGFHRARCDRARTRCSAGCPGRGASRSSPPRPAPWRTDNRMLAIDADAELADLPAPDVVLVPGGPGEVCRARAGGPPRSTGCARRMRRARGRRPCAPAR